VLITDENAQVIGSGDVSRVGTIHEASVAVVKSGVAASHNAAEAAALVGVRPGITMPIVLDGAVVGTVGITGSPAQVVRLGRLVQRQTEILLRESLFQRTRLLRENRLTQLARDIVEFDPRIVDEQIIHATAVELGYDLGQQRGAIMFEVQPGPESYPSSVRAIGEVFDARTDIVAELAAGRYVVLHHPSPDDAETLRSLARRAAALLRERHGVVVHIGIGESGSGVAALADSCADAKAALQLVGDGTGEIREISDLRVRQLLDSTSNVARARFTRSQLVRLSGENDFPALRETLVAWCECGFNLVTTAQRLAIHRNTVIYRLDKVSRLTARDARAPAVAIALYLACLFGD
jgi:carbohydrate diacid regulator